MRPSDTDYDEQHEGIAIIGMAGRFPGASSIEEFRKLLFEGRDAVHRFTKEELLPHEFDSSVMNEPNYIRARGILPGIEMFDAAFFAFMPREAALTDPQQRLWLEVAWESLEQSGYTRQNYEGNIGIFTGYVNSTYLLYNLLATRVDVENFVRTRYAQDINAVLNNTSTYLATRTAYKLNLKGPAVNVQTACSTSLVSVVMAVQSLLQYESDICIAGGVNIVVPQFSGYFYQEGGIMSKDGYCRPFDANATGTVFGSGVGAVILKRLDEAIQDRDPIWAVIRGAAMNNDGADKVGFAAPSVNGQAKVISTAQALAEINPETITYVEAHGTATPLGDPIEVAGLVKAFGDCSGRRQFCGLGSLKSNIGHLDAAAGIAGLIKAVLALQHRQIPATLHFEKLNSNINLDETPFYIVDKLTEWKSSGAPLRAGVSSFGVGGTNAHVVLEEAPTQAETQSTSREYQLLLLSAKTQASLDGMVLNLSDAMENSASMSIPDAAWTLHKTRKAFAKRRFVVSENNRESAVSALRSAVGPFVGKGEAASMRSSVAFAFPGQGSLYRGMGEQLAKCEPVFRESLESCCQLANRHIEVDLAEVFTSKITEERFRELIGHNGIAQLAIFSFDLSLARLWMSLGVQPDTLIGHSLGEWVAACVSGVLSLEHAIEAVWNRGRLMQSIAGNGGALTVFAAPQTIEPYLDQETCIAAENTPTITLVSGPRQAVTACSKRLEEVGIESRMLDISVAVHSPAIDAVIEPFEQILQKLHFSAPSLPLYSPAKGRLLTVEEAQSPTFWARQMRSPVLFSAAIVQLFASGKHVLLEVGAGVALSALAKQHEAYASTHATVSSLGKETTEHEQKRFLRAVGSLWANGVEVNADTFWRDEVRRTVPLPTYAFDRQRYWVDPPKVQSSCSDVSSIMHSREDVENNPVDATEVAVDDERTIEDRILKIVERISGISLGNDIDKSQSFVDMGFDSLFLAQMSFSLKQECRVDVPMRQLLKEYGNLNSLIEHIRKLRPELEISVSRSKQKDTPSSEPTRPSFDRSFYFGEEDSLYGLIRLPQEDRKKSEGILFCYPIGQEYIRSHWAFRLLSNYLLQEGFPVLKFDYFGTGDSLGNADDWNIERWVRDLLTAAELLKKESGAEQISLVALRFGAVIAAKALEAGLAVNRCIVWDPVLSGSEYLSDLNEMNETELTEFESRFPFPNRLQMGVSPSELLGFVYGADLRDKIKSESLSTYSFRNCTDLHLLFSNTDRIARDLIEKLRAIPERAVYSHPVSDQGFWNDISQKEVALLPSNIIGRIVGIFMNREEALS